MLYHFQWFSLPALYPTIGRVPVLCLRCSKERRSRLRADAPRRRRRPSRDSEAGTSPRLRQRIYLRPGFSGDTPSRMPRYDWSVFRTWTVARGEQEARVQHQRTKPCSGQLRRLSFASVSIRPPAAWRRPHHVAVAGGNVEEPVAASPEPAAAAWIQKLILALEDDMGATYVCIVKLVF
ncbi:uncharacterized protein LOC144376336 [Ictidomys tridecemlineatus]